MDIYGDLEHFDFSEEIDKLRQENKTLLDQISALENEKKSILEKYTVLQKESKELRINISSLHKTSMAEIQRKDKTIAELRENLDSVVYRRDKPNHNRPYGRGPPPVNRGNLSQPEQVTNPTTTKEPIPNLHNSKPERNENDNRKTLQKPPAQPDVVSQEVSNLQNRPQHEIQPTPNAKADNRVDVASQSSTREPRKPLNQFANDRIEERRIRLTQLEFEKDYREINSRSTNPNSQLSSVRFSPRKQLSREREYSKQDSKFRSRSRSKEKYHRSYKHSRSPHQQSDHKRYKRDRSNSRDRKRSHRSPYHSSKHDRSHKRSSKEDRYHHSQKYSNLVSDRIEHSHRIETSQRPKDCRKDCYIEERLSSNYRHTPGASFPSDGPTSGSNLNANKVGLDSDSSSKGFPSDGPTSGSNLNANKVGLDSDSSSKDKGIEQMIKLEKEEEVVVKEEYLDKPLLLNEIPTDGVSQLCTDIKQEKIDEFECEIDIVENEILDLPYNKENNTDFSKIYIKQENEILHESHPDLCNSSQKVVKLKKQRRIIKYSFTETPKVKEEKVETVPDVADNVDKMDAQSDHVKMAKPKQLDSPKTSPALSKSDKPNAENTVNVKIFRRKTIIKKS